MRVPSAASSSTASGLAAHTSANWEGVRVSVRGRVSIGALRQEQVQAKAVQGKVEHCRPKRPGDSTGAGRVWTDQGLALTGGDQPTGVLVAGQSVGSGNKGIAEAERLPSPGRNECMQRKPTGNASERRRIRRMAVLDDFTRSSQIAGLKTSILCNLR
jgi:hypothetical protein